MGMGMGQLAWASDEKGEDKLILLQIISVRKLTRKFVFSLARCPFKMFCKKCFDLLEKLRTRMAADGYDQDAFG